MSRVRCMPLLGGPRLKDRDVGASFDLTREGKACAVEERFVFLQGALPASGKSA